MYIKDYTVKIRKLNLFVFVAVLILKYIHDFHLKNTQ